MDEQKLFSIGDMAKLFHISVSSLRHYDRVGLLKPEYIDPDSGYRYYSTRQFEALNTVRYLRALDIPLTEIEDFFDNRDVECMEEKLKRQKETVVAKQAELKRVERKIDNRLRMISDAKNSRLDEVSFVRKEPCRAVWVNGSLQIHSFLDMETPIRKLEETQAEALIFLGKVGVGISEDNLKKGRFDRYDGVFLILDAEDRFEGETVKLPEALCVSVRFRGSHTEAPRQYRKLAAFIAEHKLTIGGFSREITLIDYGFTADTEKFVTEISIPVSGI